jgi:hypothetical protein
VNSITVTRVTRNNLRLAAAAIAGSAVLYLLGAWGVARTRGHGSILSVPCLEPRLVNEITWAGWFSSVIMAAGAVLFLYVAPTLLAMLIFRGRERTRTTAHIWSLAANSLALVVVLLVLRSAFGIDRLSFFLGWLTWSILLAAITVRTPDAGIGLGGLWRRYRTGLVAALLTVIVGVLLFRSEQFLQCFNGDGVESFELARSLRDHFLPTWEIEPIDRFGAVIVNPSLINSYWTFGLQVLLGEGELATRLPYWVYWLGIQLVCFRLARQFGRVDWGTAAVVALSTLLVTLWNTFYVGYNPYMADLANPGVPDAMFTLFLMLSFDALLQRNMAAWVVASVLGSLVLYAGPVMFVLTIVFAMIFRPVERVRLLRAAMHGTITMAAIAGAYLWWGWHAGLLDGWRMTLQSEYVADFFAPYPRALAAVIFTGYFILGCGGVPAVAVVRPLLRTRRACGRQAGVQNREAPAMRSGWERTVAAVVLAYLAIVLCSAAKNLHYLVPLLSPAVMLWSVAQVAAVPRGSRHRSWVALLSLMLCLGICWPRSRPVFTLTRELGELTTFQTSSYQEACRWADVVLLYDLGVTSWPVGPHVWVAYSSLELEPTERQPILLTTGAAPSGYRVRAESPSTKLKLCLDITRSDWLRWSTSRRPEAGPERFPWVFQPIAVRPRDKLPL